MRTASCRSVATTPKVMQRESFARVQVGSNLDTTSSRTPWLIKCDPNTALIKLAKALDVQPSQLLAASEALNHPDR